MNDDPVELLRELAAAERRDLPVATTLTLSRELVTVPARVRPVHRRRKLFAALAVALVGSGGALAWAITRHERPSNPAEISCLQFADLQSSQIAVPADGTDPVALCARARREQAPEWGTVPPMVACVAATGITVVVPGDDATCGRLGLVDLDPTETPEDLRLVEFEGAVTKQVDVGCLPPERMEAIVEQALRSSGLVGWTITIQGEFTSLEPCGALGFDATLRAITITPLPDVFS